MRRRLFNIAAALSLVLCVAVCVLWVRSYRGESKHGDSIRFISSGRLHHAWTNPGHLAFGVQPDIRDIDLGSTRIDIRDGPLPGIGVSTGLLNGGPLWRVGVDFWLVALVTSLPLIAWIGVHAPREIISLRRRAVGLCPACGYDLRATPGRCPECGHVPARAASPGR